MFLMNQKQEPQSKMSLKMKKKGTLDKQITLGMKPLPMNLPRRS